jgi:hypothetical protein
MDPGDLARFRIRGTSPGSPEQLQTSPKTQFGCNGHTTPRTNHTTPHPPATSLDPPGNFLVNTPTTQTMPPASTTTALLALALFAQSPLATSSLLRAREGPLDQYFQHDNAGMSIFDYAAVGTTPDEVPGTVKIDTTSEESSDPEAKTTLQHNLEKVLARQETVQEYFTGRKVFNDCKTFPYCNHIPAPPALLPPPNDLQAPNPNIWYPWQPRMKSQADAANANQDARGIKTTQFHPWYHHRDIGQKWEYDPNWETPYERPGVVPRLYNRQFQLHMYPNAMGAMVDNDMSGPEMRTPPSGAYTSESESGAPIQFGPSEADGGAPEEPPKETRGVPANAGQRGAVPEHTTGYQPPNLANQAWDGVEQENDASGPAKDDKSDLMPSAPKMPGGFRL